MPRLQYNNPAIKFDVQKVKEAGVIPELTIEFGTFFFLAFPSIPSLTMCIQQLGD